METIKKISHIFSNKQKRQLLILIIITVVGAFIELIGISIIMPFVEVISDSNIIKERVLFRTIVTIFNIKSESDFIFCFAIAIVIIYILKNIYLVCMYDLQYRFTFNNQRRLVKKLVACYLNQPYLFHVSKNITELQRNTIDDVSMFFTAVLGWIQFFTEFTVCVLILCYLFVLDHFITIGVGVILSLFAVVYLKVFKRRTLYYGEKNRTTNAERNKWIRQAFEGIKEIKIVNREDFYLNRIDKCSESYAEAFRKSSLISVLPRPLFEAVFVSALMLVVIVRLVSGVDIKSFFPILSTFAIAAFRILPSFGRLTGSLNNITYNKTAIDSVYHDLTEAENLEKKAKKGNNKDKLSLMKEIKVEQIYFRYPNSPNYIMENVSLLIPARKSIAFIGPSGAGKTTLADLILGLLEPENGKILVDGNSIYDNLEGWHQSLGYIPQNIYLMDDTIRNNILFGISEEDADEESIVRAIEDAQLKTFVDSLEMGLDTVVGERGVRISGGQRQRIGIARALYNNPDVLVLDDATSALDNDTEAAVMDAINSLHGKKTLIIIAHRLSTIENCDIKYKIESGRVESVK